MQKRGDRNEISLKELLFYNLIFFGPIFSFLALSNFLATFLEPIMNASKPIIADILMIPFMLIIFFMVVPYIRTRENVEGVRFALLAFLLVALAITIPGVILTKDLGILTGQLLHMASYIMVTFIFCPEVLGMDLGLKKWINQYKQVFILLVYSSIVIFYILGFAQVYTSIATDPNYPGAYSYQLDSENPSYSTFLYYSVVTFVTVGYGDITPVSTAARLVFGIEAILGAIINTVFIAILLVYISHSQSWLQRKEERVIKKSEKELEEKEVQIQRKEKQIERLKNPEPPPTNTKTAGKLEKTKSKNTTKEKSTKKKKPKNQGKKQRKKAKK